MGRKKIEIDLSEVERLAGLGLTQEELCHSLAISVDTLSRREKDSAEFAEAIKRGKSKAAVVVSNALMKLINKGNLGAIIWYEKTRRNLSDRLNVTSNDIDSTIESELENLAAIREAETSSANQSGSASPTASNSEVPAADVAG